MSFWELIKQRFIMDSEARKFTVVFNIRRYDMNLDPQVVTCSERREELRLIIHDDIVYLRRLPIGNDFTAKLDKLWPQNDRKFIRILT